MIHFYKATRLFVAIPAIALFLWGCGGIRANNPDLVRAREAYKDAQAQAWVNENAPVEMYDAEQALRKAEGAKNVEDLKHLAYLAERRSQIAVAVAAQQATKSETSRLSKEYNRILLDSRGAQIDKKDGKIEELEKELADLNAKKTDRGYVLTLGGVLFAFNKAELMQGAYRTIETLADFLKKYPERSVLIEGYTDSIGSSAYNMELSRRRADAVRIALLQKGIESGRIIAKGYGKDYPVATNDTEAGRQQNRRVEIVVLDAGVRPESKIR